MIGTIKTLLGFRFDPPAKKSTRLLFRKPKERKESIWKKDISSGPLGVFIFGIIIPIPLICVSINAIHRGEAEIKGCTYQGLDAILLGIAGVLFACGLLMIFVSPPWSKESGMIFRWAAAAFILAFCLFITAVIRNI